MSASVVKPEIKVDSVDEKNIADIEAFEDDNDLKFPSPSDQAWLVKLPGYLWQQWDALYSQQADDGRLQVGTLRVYDNQAPGQPQKVEILLDTSIPEQKKLPPAYQLNITATEYNNTVIFSEKDIPGYRPRNRNRNQFGKPTGIPTKSDRYADKVGYKSAIPKQTTLAPIVNNEGKAIPIEDGDYEGFMHELWASTMQTKTGLNAPPPDRSKSTAYGTIAAFSTTSRPGKGNQKKVVKEKAVRMERGALYEAIMCCFRKYKYWGLKALRNELKQPEAYIKEALETMAILIKSGDFAMNYKLNSSYQAMVEEDSGKDEIKDEVAKVETASDMSSGDDMDDFEDVEMEGTG